ncbi:P protein-like [Bactrocera tryoni]|uniref:P protein-like n=1 Tax=Bactrocera tryoni TaxID=59916 RepID=UPI001A964D2E|nr:P protein-like [Bactrocera tryoni]
MTQELPTTTIRIARNHNRHNNNFNSNSVKCNNKSENSHDTQNSRLEAGLQREPVDRPTFGQQLLNFIASENDVDFSWRALLNSIKILALILLWLVIVVIMIITKPPIDESRLFTLEPNQTRTYMIPQQQVAERVGVVIWGPFQETDRAEIKNGVMPDVVTMNVVSDAEGKEKTSVDWLIYLQTADLEQATKIEKAHVFRSAKSKSKQENPNLWLVMTTTKQVTIKLRVDAYTANRERGIWAGALILILMYAMIVTEIIDRTIASILCATLAVALLISLGDNVNLDMIMSWVDIETMLLLFSMMLLIAMLADSGIFDFFAVYAYEISKGFVWPLLTSLCLFTAVVSAFLDNVTMMLLVAPIIIRLCEALTLDPVLMLTLMVIYSNIGAACTPIGDPPNIIITTNDYIHDNGVTFGNFMLHCVPCVTLVTLQTYFLLRYIYRDESKLHIHGALNDSMQRLARRSERLTKMASAAGKGFNTASVKRKSERALMQLEHQLKYTPEYPRVLANLKSMYGIKDKPLLIKLSICFLFVLTLFLSHSFHNLHQLPLGWAALTGVLLAFSLVDITDFEALLLRIEWSTLIFFGSLFILMEVLAKIGMIGIIGEEVQDWIMLVDKKYRLCLAIMLVLWVSAVASAFLDNIPVTAMMLPIVISMAQDRELQLPLHPLVWALAMGACFGGNGTLVAASANVVSAGIANQHGYRFSFCSFFILGFPIMLTNIVVTSLYLILCHVIFEWHDPPKYE